MFRLRATSNLLRLSSRIRTPPPHRSHQQHHLLPVLTARPSAATGCCRVFSSANPEKKQMGYGTTGGITVARSKGSASGYCYGCGADLIKVKGDEAGSMGTVTKRKGFWADKKEDLKKAKIKNWALCPRCRKLRKMGEDVGSEGLVKALGPDSKMTQVFQQEVSKIRRKDSAVVVLCVDAINVNGTLLNTIRNYVGGNPILLAVTRCDLLPDYVWERTGGIRKLKEIFQKRAQGIMPADVYLCSESKTVMREIGGIQELAQDLWNNLNGRDPHVIGCANIGKSTLTEILISGFINKGIKLRHFGDRLAKKRLEKLQDSRITKSALPGTTLQNVRVPCFDDHNQCLWDTPGLLVDASLGQFPIRNFAVIRAQRPEPIEPSIHEVEEKSVALLITEKGDDMPLMRFEVRLKKSTDQDTEGPIRLVWNSTLPLEAKVVDIASARQAEYERWKDVQDVLEKEKAEQQEASRKWKDEHNDEDAPPRQLSPEEKKARKEARKQEYLERIRKEKEELGAQEWNRREAEKRANQAETRRSKDLARLAHIHEVIVEKGVGLDVAIANFGWLGVLMPRTANIKTYAPNTGVKVTNYDTLALPTSWGPYRTQPKDKGEKKRGQEGGDDGENEDEDYDPEDDEDWGMEDEYGGEFGDEFGGGFSDYDGSGGDFGYGGDEFGGYGYGDDEYAGSGSSYQSIFDNDGDSSNADDVWARFSGKHVGWQWDADTRWMKDKDGNRLEEGWNPIRETSQDSTAESSQKNRKKQRH